MASPINYLIGRGETLVQPISLKSGGGDKAHPYSFDEAFSRLTPEMSLVHTAVEALPRLACPNDEAVISVTLHPSYLAKSYHPTRLLNGLGLRQVGSRERRIMPAKWTQKEAPSQPLVAPELFIAGNRKKLASLSRLVLAAESGVQDDFRRIEHINPIGPDRIGRIAGDDDIPPLEVVLHADTSEVWGDDVLRGFYDWCGELGIRADFTRRQQVGGLSFLGFHAPREAVAEMAKFSFLRTVRRMAQLSFRDVELRATSTTAIFPIVFPNDAPVDTELRAAIFDGGLPATHPFPACVVPKDAPGIASPTTMGLQHGMQVTSAMLYGPLAADDEPQRPYSNIDHWRVLDTNGDDFELMTTLDRIMNILEQHPYEVVNLSIGPDEALFDDDVHVWTSRLDQFAASGKTLIVSAAGNNGDLDSTLGLCRIQPASDGVNVLAVGAACQSGSDWSRAGYSARGPGRSPGLVKPDVLAFGGSDQEPFFAADGAGHARGVTGTSFAAPAAARLGLGLRALFGNQLSPMALKALLVHHAECGDHPQVDVGWGRLPGLLDDIATCRPGEATVVYQGILEPSRYRRFLLPVPTDGFGSKVSLRATFVTATAVDPEDAINYTRTGVGIAFRPKTVGHPGFTKIKGEYKERSVHKAEGFFGKSDIFETEQVLRDDAQRWEAVLKASHTYNPTTLDQPVFDIEHLARANGQAAPRSEGVQYALIVTVSERGSQHLYNRIIRSYAGRLQAMRPQVEIPIRPRT